MVDRFPRPQKGEGCQHPLRCGIAEIGCKTDDPTSSTSENPKLVNKHDLPHHHGLQDVQLESDPKQKELVWQFVLPATREEQKMIGAGTCFGNIMFMHGLPAPLIQNPRARFYFTERGWNKVGRFVSSEAQKKGFIMRVIRRKNPAASQIVYRDDLQVALLPTNWKRKDR